MRKASAVLAVALAAILGAAVSAEDKPVASTSQTAREWPATAAELEGLRGLEREFRELQARSNAFLACVRDRLHAEVSFNAQRGAWVEVAPVGSAQK